MGKRKFGWNASGFYFNSLDNWFSKHAENNSFPLISFDQLNLFIFAVNLTIKTKLAVNELTTNFRQIIEFFTYTFKFSQIQYKP